MLSKYKIEINTSTIGEGYLVCVNYIVWRRRFTLFPKLFTWKCVDIFNNRKDAEDCIKENSKRKFDILNS